MWNNFAGRRMLGVMALGLILMGAAGCGARWIHASKGPDQLVVDENECRKSAEQTGLAGSMTGKQPALGAYYEAFTNCMVAKGWVPKKGAKAAKKQMALKIGDTPFVEKTGEHQYSFQGRTVKLPSQVTQVKLGEVTTTDTTYQQTLTFEKKGTAGDLQGEMIFQIAREPNSFDPAPYPVAAPFFVYDQGKLASEGTWRAFAGLGEDEKWMLGLGCRWRISNKKRVIITVFTKEDPPSETPAPPSRISLAQSQTLDHIITDFLPWMNALGGKRFLRRIFKFDPRGMSTSF